MGELRGAAAEAEGVCRSAIELKEPRTRRVSGWLDAWAKATAGAIPTDVLEAALALPRDDVQARSQALQAEGLWHLRHGRPNEAAASLRQAEAAARAARVWDAYTAPAVAWLATALRHEADQVQAGDPGRATQLRRQGESAARRAARLARRFRADLPHALREHGLLLAALGRPRKGLQRLEQSLAEAEQQSARYEQARTRLALARLRAALDVPGAAGQEVEAERELRALEVVAEDGGSADSGESFGTATRQPSGGAGPPT
jgi:two-component system sensor kinase